MDASLLSKAMEAEERLASRDKKGDGLDELPPGHPLLVAAEKAKKTIENRRNVEEQSGIKKVKRVDARKKSNQIRREKEEKGDKLRNEIKALNGKLDEVARSIENFLSRDIPEFENRLQEVPYIRSRFDRIKRMFVAFHRGIMDSKFRSTNTFIE